MHWIGENVRDQATRDTYWEVADLASWSEWATFPACLPSAPREPGVYLFRDPLTQQIVYVGMAGERAGGGTPKGLFGRLSVYKSGKGAVSGFGQAALDRALADASWLASQIADVQAGHPKRTTVWAAEAIARLAPELSWAVRPERHDARLLEDTVVGLLRPHGLWNR